MPKVQQYVWNGSSWIDINPIPATHTHAISDVTNLQTTLDGKAKRINLTGQLQLNSYRRSVIALCNLTNTDTSANSYSIGTITFHRTNGLQGAVKFDFAIEKQYNSTKPNYSGLFIGSSDSSSIRPCTFTVGGVKYGGVEIFFADAEFQDIEFYGVSNFAITGYDYKDTRVGQPVLNTDINNTISFNDVVNRGSLFYNNLPLLTDGGNAYGLNVMNLYTSYIRTDGGYILVDGTDVVDVLGYSINLGTWQHDQGSEINLSAHYINLNGEVLINGSSVYHEGNPPYMPLSQLSYATISNMTSSTTLNVTYKGFTVLANNTSAITVTIPINTTANFELGSEIHFLRQNSGEVSFSPASGVTLVSEGNKRRINARYQMVTLKKIATNTWVLVGAIKS